MKVVLLVVLAFIVGAAGSYFFPRFAEKETPEPPAPYSVQNGENRDLKKSQSNDTKKDVSVATQEGRGENILDLSYQNMTSVPRDLFSNTTLTTLDLSHNALPGALPGEVRYLSKLEVLDLSDNTFTGVPAEVGQLSLLKELDLSNNALSGLPHELGNLSQLKILDLRGNKPSEFDLKIIRERIPGATILVD
jgi:Leucine-rich repeat (LRR) protein